MARQRAHGGPGRADRESAARGDRGVLGTLVDSYAAIGVEHLLVAPQDRNVDDWEKVTEGVGALAT
jgi:hypothetical protein